MSSETSTKSQAFRPWELFTLAALIGGIVVVLLGRGAPRIETIFLGFTVFAAGAVGVAVWRSFAPLSDALESVTVRLRDGRLRAALEREKMLAVRSLKELEFDRAMQKISEKDFGEMSGRLRARAVRLMEQLDTGVAYRDSILQAIEQRVGADRPIDAAPAASACGACGTRNDDDARFCKSCGGQLGEESA
jgi:hypothetical protein